MNKPRKKKPRQLLPTDIHEQYFTAQGPLEIRLSVYSGVDHPEVHVMMCRLGDSDAEVCDLTGNYATILEEK